MELNVVVAIAIFLLFDGTVIFAALTAPDGPPAMSEALLYVPLLLLPVAAAFVLVIAPALASDKPCQDALRFCVETEQADQP